MGYRIRLVKRPELLSPAHFLRYILRTEMQVDVARRILERIGRDGWDCREWRRLCSEEGIKQGMYSKVIKQLSRAGLLEKRGFYYFLSKDFTIAMRRMAEYWKTLVEAVDRGERVNF